MKDLNVPKLKRYLRACCPNFVKDVYAVGKKWPEVVVNWPNAKVDSFFNGQSL